MVRPGKVMCKRPKPPKTDSNVRRVLCVIIDTSGSLRVFDRSYSQIVSTV